MVWKSIMWHHLRLFWHFRSKLAVTFSESYATNKPVKPCLVSVRSPDIGTGQVSWGGFVAEKSQGLRANFSEKELVILLWCCLSKTPGKVRKTHLQCSPCLDDSDDKKNIYPIKILSCKLTRDDYIFSNLLIFYRDQQLASARAAFTYLQSHEGEGDQGKSSSWKLLQQPRAPTKTMRRQTKEVGGVLVRE